MRIAAWWLMAIVISPLASGCLQMVEGFHCDDEYVELNGRCTPGSWNIVGIDFQSNDEFEVVEGDLVRLVFDPATYGHYIPNSFYLEGYEITQEIFPNEVITLDFLADKSGNFSFSSSGLCRIDIPGAGEIMVDCSIFCGETENGRTGVISVMD